MRKQCDSRFANRTNAGTRHASSFGNRFAGFWIWSPPLREPHRIVLKRAYLLCLHAGPSSPSVRRFFAPRVLTKKFPSCSTRAASCQNPKAYRRGAEKRGKKE